MGKISYYLDEHFPKAVAKGLRARGLDVKTCVEADMLGANDPEQLAFASGERRVMVTQDSDFLQLHAGGVEHAGIIFFSRPKTIGDLIRDLLLVYEILEAEDMQNHVEFL